MSTENTKQKRSVVLFFSSCLLLVLGCMIVEFNFVDMLYFIVLVVYLVRYISLKYKM